MSVIFALTPHFSTCDSGVITLDDGKGRAAVMSLTFGYILCMKQVIQFAVKCMTREENWKQNHDSSGNAISVSRNWSIASH